jgi:class 3 adenylate cyclase
MENPKQKNLLISFCDLTNFGKISREVNETDVFNYLSKIYEIIGEIIESSNGQVIKFIGDAALIIFEEININTGIIALKKLKTEVDEYNRKNNYDSRLIVKAHFGQVIAGMIGTKNDKRYDILGNEVNIAATIKSNGYAISVDTFRKLNPETRKLFKKHTPPITYIDIDERHKD